MEVHLPHCPNSDSGDTPAKGVEYRVNMTEDRDSWQWPHGERLTRDARTWPNGKPRRWVESRKVGAWGPAEPSGVEGSEQQ